MSSKPFEMDVSELLNEAAAQFDKLCQDRHEAGAKEYGQFTFLGNDVVRMMIEELADTVNYSRMQAVKLMILQQFLEQQVQDEMGEGTEEITIGVKAFKGTSEMGWNK